MECMSPVEVDCYLTGMHSILTEELLGSVRDHPRGNYIHNCTITPY